LTGLGTDDVVLAAVGGFGHGIGEALQAVGGHGGADRALQNRHLELIAAGTGSLALSSHILVNPIEGIGTLLQGVGKDVGHIQRGVRSHAAVHQDHRD
ncbi:Galactarate dehydratase, partial [Dysosmobacter welbionis]